MPLSGKVAVITGSSGGIGAAIAQTLAAAGAKVVLGARRIEELETVKNTIEAEVGSDTVMVCKVDVTKRDEVKALVAAAEAGFGPIDIMVNNAGEHERQHAPFCLRVTPRVETFSCTCPNGARVHHL